MRYPIIPLSLAAALAACGASETREAAPPESVTIMAFNVQNLFDTVDDPGKDDKAYLPIEAKQNAAHIAECNEIPVESWRNECLYLDWGEAALKHKLGRDVRITSEQDPELIGGLRLRAGDMVIDGSVAGQLGKLAQDLGL